jgi:oligopeptide transport system substrate-binding protein
MNKKLSLMMTALLAATFLFSSCTKKKDFKEKVIHIVIGADVKGLDPIYADDSYSGKEVSKVYEGLLQYHYLKRPYVLIPNLAESMPTVSDDGFSYTFKLKKGVMFHDDKSFEGGKGREMTADDVIYSFMRIGDPKLQSTGWWVMDGKIKGLNEWREAMMEKDKVDYRAKLEGVEKVDKYTVKFTLKKPFPQFLYAFAMSFFKVVPREAVEFYGKEFVNHPVGTGPFTLKKYDRTKTITYLRNKKYRDDFFPTEGSDEDKKAGLLAAAGKKIPFVDKIVSHIITESQPRWLNFLKGKVGLLSIPKDNFAQAVTPDRRLNDSFEKKGMKLIITPGLDVTYTAFNHSVKIFQNKKLRQAMSLAFDVDESNRLFFNSTGLPAQSLVPPGVAGYEKSFRSEYAKLDLAKAKKLLAEAGYPDGKGLAPITYECLSSTVSRQQAEFFAKSMAKIGIVVKANSNTWPEMTKKIKSKSAMMWGISWLADYPDAENFLQLIYGPNKAPGANGSNYDEPEFNEIYKKASLMQHSPIRTALYEKLKRMSAEAVPWIYGIHRMNFTLKQGWIKNFKDHSFPHGMEKFYGVDLSAKKELSEKL